MKLKEKKRSYLKFLITILVFIILAPTITVKANAPYITWTSGPNGEIVDTQTAYVPDELYQLGLNSPEDLFVDKKTDTIYICDTGNKRVVVIETDGTAWEISGEPMVKPTGIFVTDEYIYVADYEAQKVLIYNKQGDLQQTFGRPEEPLFGANTKFVPLKLTVDNRGNVYVVSEGSTSGLMQLNVNGEFLGYFGSNQTNTSFKMILQKTFFTEEQLNKLFKNVPPSASNVAIDSQGLIYTVTKGEIYNPVKKLSISGLDLFPGSLVTDYQIVDAAIDNYGNVFSVSAYGTIFEYDSYGSLLFAFGGQDNGLDRMGLITSPSGIDVLSDGSIVVLDQAKGFIQKYRQTEFASMVHEGISLYKSGLYEESEEIWVKIRKMNSSFTLAYDALAKASFKKQDYESALDQYKIAENRAGYSNTFWEYRNQWLQNNLSNSILILLVLYITWLIVKKFDKKSGILYPIKKVLVNIHKIPLVNKILYMKKMLKSPIDGFFEIKFRNRANITSATFWYFILFVLQITGIYVTGYIFNNKVPKYTSLFQEVLQLFFPIALWIICNYLVSTISDGKGKFRDIYCGTIYSFAPYLFFAFPLQLLSNVLTHNESFVYSYGFFILYAWSMVLFIIMVKEIHAYSFKDTVKNILITLFTIVLFVLIAFIMYLLFKQMKDFFVGLYQEVSIRV